MNQALIRTVPSVISKKFCEETPLSEIQYCRVVGQLGKAMVGKKQAARFCNNL